MSTESQQQIAREAWERIRRLNFAAPSYDEEGESIIIKSIERATEEVIKQRDAWKRVANWDAQPQRSEQQEWTDYALNELVMDLRVATGNFANIHRSFLEILKPWFDKHNAALAAERQRRERAEQSHRLLLIDASNLRKERNESRADNKRLKEQWDLTNQDLRNTKQRELSAQAAIDLVRKWFDAMGDSSPRGRDINLGQLREAVFALDLPALHKHDKELLLPYQAAIERLSSASFVEVSQNIARMVTAYVEGGLSLRTDWRNGLSKIISKRLKRLQVGEDVKVDLSALREHDEQVRADAWTKWHKFFVPDQVREPLVETLKDVRVYFADGDLGAKEIDEALAKVRDAK